MTMTNFYTQEETATPATSRSNPARRWRIACKQRQDPSWRKPTDVQIPFVGDWWHGSTDARKFNLLEGAIAAIFVVIPVPFAYPAGHQPVADIPCGFDLWPDTSGLLSMIGLVGVENPPADADR